MRWKEIFMNSQCIICGETTPYYVCDKCRNAVMWVRERTAPTAESLEEHLFIKFIKRREKKKNANRT